MIRRCFQYSNSTYLQRPSGHTCTCNFLTSQYCAFDKSPRFVRTNITRVNRSGYPDDLSGEKKIVKTIPNAAFPAFDTRPDESRPFPAFKTHGPARLVSTLSPIGTDRGRVKCAREREKKRFTYTRLLGPQRIRVLICITRRRVFVHG